MVRLEDGTELNVVRAGDPGAPVTVVLAHGYALDHRSWHKVVEQLSADFQVVVGSQENVRESSLVEPGHLVGVGKRIEVAGNKVGSADVNRRIAGVAAKPRRDHRGSPAPCCCSSPSSSASRPEP